MTSSEDTEITLGTGKLLFLFFSLVAICALFFALGYSLGRKAEPGIMSASAAVLPQQTPGVSKPATNGAAQTPPMTFYKSVEQKDANPQLMPSSDTKTDTTATDPANASANPQQTPAAAAPQEPVGVLPAGGYFVQVAAVSKQEDADALVDALKKKQYPAFVAVQSATDKLFHVQVGPFGDVKDAEGMRAKLVGDGYSPIVKK